MKRSSPRNGFDSLRLRSSWTSAMIADRYRMTVERIAIGTWIQIH